jgi:hypothetical protein
VTSKKIIKFCENFEKNIGLNLSLKDCFEKCVKKRKKTYPFSLSVPAAQRPASHSPRQPTPPPFFFFSFLSMTTGSHWSASPSPLPFFSLPSAQPDPV